MKYIKYIAFFSLAAFLAPAVALAASLAPLPDALSLQTGRDYSIPIYVTPTAGEKIYTVKVTLSYPSELVSVTGFSFAPSWLPLTQPGYDSIGNGTVIKTAGYPGGISSQILVGTLSISANASGSGSISVTSGAQTLDSNNANTLSGRGSTQITISAPAPATPSNPIRTPTSPAATKPKTIPKTTVQSATVATMTTTSPVEAAPTDVAATSTSSPQVAAAERSTGDSIPTGLALVIAVVSFILGVGVGMFIRRT
ncbi:MAG: hypothetical protein Q7S05_00410 [bacterium]|nr:hypothetical protein [bacterium]